jgi:hypothetical protein
MRSIQLGVAVVAILSMSACGSTPSSPSPANSVTLSGDLSFGNVTAGTSAMASLTISQAGSTALTITSISYPSGFTGNWPGGVIPGAGSQLVTVTFAPTALTTYGGAITVNQDGGAATITTSGTGSSASIFTLSGLVTESAPTTSTVLAGARVTFVDGANQGRSAVSGADGRYEITGVSEGGYTVSATLAGYVGVAVPVGIVGHSILTIRLNPVAARTSFGPGQYLVSEDLPAGRYYSDPVDGCHFQRQRAFGGGASDTIVDTVLNFDAAQWVVDLLPSDAGFETDANCRTWFTTPRRGAQTDIAPGMWVVGSQVAPGTYRADAAVAGCYWQRVSNFTGSAYPDTIIANAFLSSNGPQIVTIASSDAGFSGNDSCGVWTRTAAATHAGSR